MATTGNRRWVLSRRVDGGVSEENFTWVESEIPHPKAGEFVARNLWMSFDPTQVLMIAGPAEGGGSDGGLSLGEAMRTIAVSEVVESRHPEFRPGDIVHGHMGWEDYSVSDGTGFTPTYRVPKEIPPRWAIGVLGLTGLVAYFGVHEIARPSPGETFVISGAAGGVGMVATQLAKLAGARVIAIAGSPAKCDWLRREAAVGAAIDYRAEDLAQRLTELCPQGVDIYFDNHGGPTLDLVLGRLRAGGRAVLCGVSALYRAVPPPPGLQNYVNLIMVNGRMQGLLGRDYVGRRGEAFATMLPLLRSGELRSKEDVLVGLRNAPRGLARLLAGENVGKQLLEND